MSKKMLINASDPAECRVAVVCDGVLDELDVQINTREATLGNIYKGAITRVEPSLQAVFVDYGAARNGFLSINDVHPSYLPESFESGRRRPRVQDVFRRDDPVIVQVNKEERSTKGASLTTNISLAGRYLVLMPGTDLYGVSRKIEDEKERKKLKEILQQLKPPDHMGFIIRTAGMGRTKTELSRDLAYLLKLWQSIEGKVSDLPAPSLLYQEHDLVIRSIREHFTPDITEILVDHKDVYNQAREFFQEVMPKYENIVKLSQEKRPLFNKYQLEEQIEQVYRRKIKLKSGGYILIEPTEAMVTVDVNSGSATKEKGIEDTAFRVNMEAAPEIARQLRLRDLGGIIVIDFIDMMHKNHKLEVEKALKAVLKDDRAKSKVLRISTLGLLELSRQRLKSSLGTGEYLDCPLCDGRGTIKSPEMSAVSVFRKIKSLLIKGNVGEVRVAVPERVADSLLNGMRSQLHELETLYGARITVLIRQTPLDKETTFEVIREEAHEAPALEAVPAQPPIHALAPLVQPEPEPELEPAVAAQEEPAAEEEEKKRARKPQKRRRRSRKKITPELGEQILAPTAEVEEPTADADSAGDASLQEALLGAVLEEKKPPQGTEPARARHAPSRTGARRGRYYRPEPSAAPESSETDGQAKAPASQPEAVETQPPQEALAPVESEPVPKAADGSDVVASEGDSAPADPPEAPNKDTAPRKRTLASYLPFT